MTKSTTPGPFIDPTVPMMSTVLDQLNRLNLPGTKERDLKSAIRSLCRLISRDPGEVPANINWVHVRLRRIHPVQAGISKKRFKNIKSDLLKALELCGCSRERSDWMRPPSPEWQNLFDRIPDKHDIWKLSQLAQYCTARSVSPRDVNDDHVRGLLNAIESETFVDKPAAKVSAAVSVWNRLRKTIDSWPSQPLTFPRAKEPWTIPLNQFPDSFQKEVERWRTRLSCPDPFEGTGPIRALRPATIQHRTFQIRMTASALVRSGIPIAHITSIAVLVEIENVKIALRYMMARFNNKSTEAIHGLAMGLTALARHHVIVDPDHLEALRGICKRLNLEVDGLRAKNQQRLAQLDDERNLSRLLHLPERLVRVSRNIGLRPHRAALYIQAALAIEVLLHAPMRIGNLCRLSLDRHLRRVTINNADCLILSIPGHEVKNGKDLTFEITGDAIALFDLYMKEVRPILLRQPSEYVFPAQNGDHKAPLSLSRLIKDVIYEHTGMDVHAHLFRSIAGHIHCMIHPGDFLTLGHAIGDSLKTAMKAYAQFEQKNAVRHYQGSVEEARRRLKSGKG